ncbi:oxygenase MpaB family protein [Streptomyces sp. V3I7]|uniref:oxygenase MpaB family protein n=1 Tax=Streptomyces sp. V3I7 TaxID=3042278 RepID=UPI0027D82005|nr:oxygenase MpaB family protein [Streptomyces sp. V3I7]
MAGVREVDEELLDLIGRRMYERDEPGADLVRAMRRGGAPGTERVTMAQFNKALEEGVQAVPDAPPALVRFFAMVDDVPPWVDFELIERGAAVFRRFGRTANDVLLQLSLIGGYRFGGPAELLVATGGLSGATAMRRLGETETWAHALAQPGAMRRDGAGFRLTVHVRVMHALVNDRFENNGRWDAGEWGLPVNQSDQAGTLGLFNSTLLLGARVLGWYVSAEDSRAVMHLWKYVGWLLGVNEDWLFDTEREQNAFNYHILLAQDGQTAAGGDLSRAIVDGERRLRRGRLSSVRSAYARARLLSMLRYFLGRESLEDLRLPVTLPWAVPPVVAKNLVASLLLARSEPGRRRLERASAKFRQRRGAMLFDGDRHQVGALPL